MLLGMASWAWLVITVPTHTSNCGMFLLSGYGIRFEDSLPVLPWLSRRLVQGQAYLGGEGGGVSKGQMGVPYG